MDDHVGKPINPIELYKALERNVDVDGKAKAPAAKKAQAAVIDTLLKDKKEGEESHIDTTSLSDIEKALGKDFMINFLQENLGEVKTFIDQIEEARKKDDMELMVHSAHELKGLCAMFGLSDVRALAEGIEACCMQEREEEAKALVEKVPARFVASVDMLQKIYPIKYAA